MNNYRQIFAQIWQTYSGEAAWQTVSDLSRYHRIQASPGYRRAAGLLHRRLTRDGLAAEILSYPADERTSFWAMPSFQEWACSTASLQLVEPAEQAQVLADFRACPISLIQRSTAFAGEVEVVPLPGQQGEEETDYEGLDVRGKAILSGGDLRRVSELAVVQRGAVGILYDGLRAVPPVRPRGDLADVRQYTSFWWRPGDTRCFGFVLTPRQGQMLRRLAKEDGARLRVRARIDARLYDGSLEVVSALIPGEEEGEILVTAHLCHPQPSANDNASGAAAAMEAALTLQTLIEAGGLPAPRRGIRFLWMPEMTGTFAYLAAREGELEQLVAGLNLDMVGEDQAQTGSSWLIERPPDAAASFAPDLLIWLREELLSLKGMTSVSPSHTGLGEYALYRQAVAAFSGGSDHYILSDPKVGVPTPMLIQWPDRFYHTAADTPDRTDPQSLARAGSLAAAYAYWLATAGVQEATWLGYEMAARFKARLVDTAQKAVSEALATEGPDDLARAAGHLDRKLAYLLDRHRAALGSLDRLAPVACLIAELQAEAERATRHELAWARGAVELHAAAGGLESLPTIALGERPAEEQRAADLVPRRKVRGPIPLREHLPRLDEADRQAWRQLLKERKDGGHHTLLALGLYWADGQRSVLEIADRIELESDRRDVELLLTYFDLLEKLGFVSLEHRGAFPEGGRLCIFS